MIKILDNEKFMETFKRSVAFILELDECLYLPRDFKGVLFLCQTKNKVRGLNGEAPRLL